MDNEQFKTFSDALDKVRKVEGVIQSHSYKTGLLDGFLLVYSLLKDFDSKQLVLAEARKLIKDEATRDAQLEFDLE